MKVRISRRVIGHLEGSDAWQSGQRVVESGFERQSTADMMEAIKAAPRRKDGSVTVDLDDEQRAALLSTPTSWRLPPPTMSPRLETRMATMTPWPISTPLGL
ncbi:hypothetical protein SEA_PHUSCO_150 [Mycobacterium phage Phusco]|nr:hypothetical protein SEA_PHUSCO_150 [Mycobacterium phage Phusco]